MPPLDHWHPILFERELGQKPRAVQICGIEVVIFRGADGRIGALQHECPHRRMPLSAGRVDGNQLVCAYHGWRFAPDGSAHCPAMPDASMEITHFDISVLEGLIWLKNANASASLPSFDETSRIPVCQLQMRFRAPLELVTDNLAEMEHTGEAHLYFGYDTDKMHEVEIDTEVGDDFVRIQARGPQRRLPPAIAAARRLTGSKPDDIFIDDLLFRFSPVHVVSDGYWISKRTGRRRPEGLHSKVFLVPRTAEETDLFGFYYLPTGSPPLSRLLRPLLKQVIRLELRRDQQVTERVAQCSPRIEDLQLSRFDQPLLEIREAIDRLYGQLEGQPLKASSERCSPGPISGQGKRKLDPTEPIRRQ